MTFCWRCNLYLVLVSGRGAKLGCMHAHCAQKPDSSSDASTEHLSGELGFSREFIRSVRLTAPRPSAHG
jgi:hypothetical protein